MDLFFQSLDPARLTAPDLTDAERADLVGWFQATSRGFHLPRLADEALARWATNAERDGSVLRGAWTREEGLGATHLPVATLSSWDGDVNTGAGTVPLRMISNVTVSPAHRRRGLARRLVTDDLHDAARAGLPLAGLTVSEGAIYRRFGFGPATFKAGYEVDVTSRFAVEHPEVVGGAGRGGRCVHVEPADVWEPVENVFRAWHALTRGSVTRHAVYEDLNTGARLPESREPDNHLRGVLHLDAHGHADGYALYRHDGWGKKPLTARVTDMVALNASAHMGLWEFLAGLDLTDRVTVSDRLDIPLRWALADNRCVSQTKVSDHLWLRILDLPVAWKTRPWFGDGTVVLAVDDPLGFIGGCWRLQVSGGQAEVTPVDADSEQAQISLDAATLGALHLGAVSVETLAIAGRVRGDEAALGTFAAMADGGDVPYCGTFF